MKIAIIGTGGMARFHAKAFSEIEGCSVVAACDVEEDKVQDFSKTFSIEKSFTSYEKMLAEVECDAVTLVVPDPFHHPIALDVIAAGKHILCEKPLALNYAEAAEMREAALKAQVINMVNLSYRNSAAIQMASQLVTDGILGEVRHVHAYYLQGWLAHDAWGEWRESPQWLWRLSKKHGSGGVLGDIGVHILDFAGMPLGDYRSVHCQLKTFDKVAGDKIGDYNLDANDSAIITAEFENGALGTIHTTRWAYPHQNSLRLNLYGDKAAIEIDLDTSYTELKISRILRKSPMAWESLECPQTPTNFERFASAVMTGVQDQPDFARGAAVQKVLDACFESDAKDRTIGL